MAETALTGDTYPVKKQLLALGAHWTGRAWMINRMFECVRVCLFRVDAGREPMDYMVRDFIPALRTCLKDGGFAKIDRAEESGGCFLLGIRGRIFEVSADFQVGESIHDYAAAGCGRDVALGSLCTSGMASGLSARERINRALCAAERHSAGVRGPLVFIEIPDAMHLRARAKLASGAEI